MAEGDDSRVPTDELTEFAKSLFTDLYAPFGIVYKAHGYSRLSKYKHRIAEAILHVRKNAVGVNTDILDNCFYRVIPSVLCQKVCDLYPVLPLFQKLYYISAFILDLMIWWDERRPPAKFDVGPDLWIEMFQNNFEEEFRSNDGWKGIIDVGNRLLAMDNFSRQEFTVDHLRIMTSGLDALTPRCGDETDVVMDEVEETLNLLKCSTVSDVSRIAIELAPIEEDEPEPEPVGAVGGGYLGERIGRGRRRRQDADLSDSDSEPDSHSPSKAKIERTG